MHQTLAVRLDEHLSQLSSWASECMGGHRTSHNEKRHHRLQIPRACMPEWDKEDNLMHSQLVIQQVPDSAQYPPLLPPPGRQWLAVVRIHCKAVLEAVKVLKSRTEGRKKAPERRLGGTALGDSEVHWSTALEGAVS